MVRLARVVACVLAIALAAACGHSSGSMNGPSMNNKVGGSDIEYKSPVVSWDILEREPVANEVQVRHILIGWKDLAEAYGGQLADAAKERTRTDAENEVTALLGQLKAGADFNQLMREHSEDTGSASSDTPITVTPEPPLAIEFRQLALRLQPGEIGVCQTEFGFHIIKRE
jgi:parvulin-like peptidyl-prolyl isomerase